MDEASAVELSAAAPASTTPTVDDKSAADAADSELNASVCMLPAPVASGKQRAGRRGLTTRKRLGLALKIDASETDGQKDSEAREGQPTSAGTPGSDSADAKALSDAVPWWILEYKCPPPGHLGAHDVPVAAKDEAKQLVVSGLSSLASEEKRDEPIVGLSQRTAGERARQTLALTTEQPTGVRDIRQRRQQQHSDSIDYSPSQKRKMDPSALSPAVVAKEPKRFRERSNEAPSDASSTPTAVTPSNLVRPLNKIDIHCQRSAASVATAPSVATSEATAKVTSTSASHASSSA